MNGVLVDTSIIIDFLRQKDKRKTIQIKLEQSQIPLYASIITHTECFSGKSIWEKTEALQTLKSLFSDIKILPLEEEISEKAGETRAKYGRNLSDAIIAATTLFHKLELATLNRKDFENIKGIKLFTPKT
ncbi:type II toxin-antitoxin system VapC family toxin [Candidatus Daviesbacteria bacterium]|nr:type II toxin-antitoxin system VapC family toxin [Candidatus Daviesbacteria bacterium]